MWNSLFAKLDALAIYANTWALEMFPDSTGAVATSI
jgi:hypothetical protein